MAAGQGRTGRRAAHAPAALWIVACLPSGAAPRVARAQEGCFVEAERRLAGTLGAPGAGPGQLRRPRDVAVLPDGRLAIADGGNHRVQLWDEGGAFLRS